mmetsp:Transcript_46082/g.112544  ORF Transcript_46082/g.112544 Transcript_46082/m.112544 type:complete len:536 (+) Transcript_46082:66-1673(+)
MDDLTRSVTVKRTAKKKSGYTVSEQNGVYYVSEAPAKARVTPGDKIVGINGIRSDDFLDEDDANDLIESIRIVVIPEDKIEEFDDAAAAAEAAENGGDDEEESDDEEQYEEYDRRSKPKGAGSGRSNNSDDDENNRNAPRGGGALNSIPNGGGGGGRGNNDGAIQCNHCGHENDDLSVDEDGDYVCEECGHVIDVPKGAGKDGGGGGGGGDDIIHTCVQCGHGNLNLEPDEDGDYVCEECGHVIPEGNAAPANGGHNHDHNHDHHTMEEEDAIYECPDCDHHNVNPVPDDEGDLVCEDCGCILPPKLAVDCAACGHTNVEPVMDEEGDYVCQHCGEVLDVEEPEMTAAEKLKEKSDMAGEFNAEGQEFDEDGNPLTNPEGKKLTPADMFGPGDVITVTIGKSHPKQDPGLKLEGRNGKYYVKKVSTGGLFAKTPVMATDKVLELNGTDYREFKDVNELKRVMREEPKITIVVLRLDPDASESSASSVDYNELNPITPDGEVNVNDVQARGLDDDTVGYDGHDCGCVWCPDCQPEQ